MAHIKIRVYDNWAKYPIGISGTVAIYGISSWIVNDANLDRYNLTYSDLPNDIQNDFNLWICMAIIGTICFLLFEYLNYYIEFKGITGCSTREESEAKIDEMLKYIYSVINDKNTTITIQTNLDSLLNPIKRYLYIDGINKEVEELQQQEICLMMAERMLGSLSKTDQDVFVEAFKKCENSYLMKDVIKKYLNKSVNSEKQNNVFQTADDTCKNSYFAQDNDDNICENSDDDLDNEVDSFYAISSAKLEKNHKYEKSEEFIG